MRLPALFAAFWLLVAPVAGAQEQGLDARVLVGKDLRVKPTLRPLIEVLARSGVSKVSTSVTLIYDETGKVTHLKLDKTTGSKPLDKALLGWAAEVEIDAREPGIGTLPIELEEW